MKHREPRVNMRVGYIGDDGWDGKSGKIISREKRVGKCYVTYPRVLVKWNDGREEWIDTAKLEAE